MDHIDGMNGYEGFYFLQLSDDLGADGINYYEEYSKLHVSNLLMRNKIDELREEKTRLKEQLDTQTLLANKEKRSRRKAGDIARHYQCEHCGKTYGSEASLKYHIKIKHPENN